MIVGHIGGSSSGGYEIQKSLRFRASASAYLSRTPSVSGNRKTWTWSGWVKRGILGVVQVLMSSDVGTSVNTWGEFGFDASDKLYFSSYSGVRSTTALFRDPSASYHIQIVFDTTQGVEADRIKFYVNGVRQTQTGDAGFPALNTDYGINNTQAHDIGRRNWASGIGRYFDGYLSEINFIDGQALDPSYFGQVSAETGSWIPKKYTGTYGTNGFYLPFNDGSTLANLAADRSGNGNNWTANNISLTSGVTYDWMDDTPTNNFAVVSTIDKASTVANGNLTTSSGAAHQGARGSIFVPSGLYYVEATLLSTTSATVLGGIGLATSSASLTSSMAGAANYWGVYFGDQRYINRNGTNALVGSTAAAGSTIQLAVDRDNNRAWVGINNVWYDGSNGTTGAPSSLSNPTFTSLPSDLAVVFQTNQQTLDCNFGQRPFAYTPPTGFKALCTKNLPEVPASLLDPTDHHIDITVTKSGDTNFTLPWDASVYDTFFEIKRRDASGDWYQIDGLRGYDKILKSNSTAAETTDANVLGVSGTTCTLKSTLPNGVYIISATKAGLSSARQTNTDGSITSTVSRNVDSGFAIVAATSNGADPFTMGHGLGVPPKMVVFKNRDGVDGFYVAHTGLTNMSSYWLVMNTTAAVASGTAIFGAGPTSTTVGIRGTSLAGNGSKVVLYCYADSAIQKSFSYTGNGSTDGPYVNLGFKCGRSLIKATTVAGYDWVVFDSARSLYNPTADHLYPNGNWAEGSTLPVYFNSNGIKIRTGNENTTNGNGHTYIGHAWAAVTGKYSNAR